LGKAKSGRRGARIGQRKKTEEIEERRMTTPKIASEFPKRGSWQGEVYWRRGGGGLVGFLLKRKIDNNMKKKKDHSGGRGNCDQERGYAALT